jgi:hypothetical protein
MALSPRNRRAQTSAMGAVEVLLADDTDPASGAVAESELITTVTNLVELFGKLGGQLPGQVRWLTYAGSRNPDLGRAEADSGAGGSTRFRTPCHPARQPVLVAEDTESLPGRGGRDRANHPPVPSVGARLLPAVAGQPR